MSRLFKLFTVLICLTIVIVFVLSNVAFSQDKAGAADLAKKLAVQKKLEQEENDILIDGRNQRGIYYYNKGYYNEAVQQFHLSLELDPNNAVANDYLNKSLEKLRKSAKKHYKKGMAYYNKGEMQQCIDEMSMIPVGSPYYEKAQEYIAYADEVLTEGAVYGMNSPKAGTQHIKDQIKQMSAEEELIMLRKKAHEQKLMMDVDAAYLPPEPYEEEEEEELISAIEIEEQEREDAQKKLRARMNENIVPALSLSDADVRDVIRELVKLTGVNIILDEGALKKASGPESMTVSFTTVTPMPLLDLLDIALKTTDLAYKVEPTYIWISDKETINSENLVVRTYKLKYGVRSTRDVELTQFGDEADDFSDEDF
jgi:tetratricopeptide (TPR) repeat protein